LFLFANKIALHFRAQIKFCTTTFFVVKLGQRKFLWRFYVSKQNSAVRFSQIEPELFELFSDRQSTAESMCVFARR